MLKLIPLKRANKITYSKIKIRLVQERYMIPFKTQIGIYSSNT